MSDEVDAVGTATQWGELILIAGGVVMSVAYGIRRVWRATKFIEHILEDVQSNKAIAEEAREAMREIRAEMKPNGGMSMRDAVNRIDARVGDLTDRVAVVEDKVVRLSLKE